MPLPKLKAPAEDGAILAVPPLEEWAELAERNRKLLSKVSLLGHPWNQHGDMARNEIVSVADAFHSRFGLESMQSEFDKPAILTGHQPDLFHPGVWAKNFAAHALAKRLGAASLNLVVDSDLTKGQGIRLPDHRSGQAETIRYDTPQPTMPFEERRILDLAEFRDIPNRLAEAGNDWPTTRAVWEGMKDSLAVSALPEPASMSALLDQQTTDRLGEAFVIGRHRLEAEWGCKNGEAPISLLCLTPTFIHFALHLLENLPQFQVVHNAALAGYRRRHCLRSRSHPVPDLGADGEWLEAPFWVWRAGDSKRRRLFAHRTNAVVRLAAVGVDREELPLKLPKSEGTSLLGGWWQLANSGWKIRPRALLTTMYARLFLADLFIHGLGGGLYDEVTDEIIRNFFGFEPPGYVILTGTLRLRDPDPPAYVGGSPATLRQRLRDWRYNPDRHLSPERNSSTLALVAAKQERIARYPDSKADRFVRFSRIHELNEQLRPKAHAEREALTAQLAEAEAVAARARLYADREYAFILHEPERLRAFFAQLRFG